MYAATSQKATSIAGVSVSPNVPSKSKHTAVVFPPPAAAIVVRGEERRQERNATLVLYLVGGWVNRMR